MVEGQFNFQNPYAFDPNSLLSMTLTFGRKVSERQYENGRNLYIDGDEASVFFISHIIFNINDMFGVLYTVNEDYDAQLFMFTLDKLDEVSKVLDSDEESIDGNLFMDNTKENVHMIFLAVMNYIQKEHNSAVEFIQKNVSIDNFEGVDSEELAKTIDDQLNGLNVPCDWSYEDEDYTYYMYNSIQNVFNLCKKDRQGRCSILFVLPDEYEKLKKRPLPSLFNNYWNMCSSEGYQFAALYYTSVVMSSNKIMNLVRMCIIAGYNIDGSKLGLKGKFIRWRLRRKLKIKNQNIF